MDIYWMQCNKVINICGYEHLPNHLPSYLRTHLPTYTTIYLRTYIQDFIQIISVGLFWKMDLFDPSFRAQRSDETTIFLVQYFSRINFGWVLYR